MRCRRKPDDRLKGTVVGLARKVKIDRKTQATGLATYVASSRFQRSRTLSARFPFAVHRENQRFVESQCPRATMPGGLFHVRNSPIYTAMPKLPCPCGYVHDLTPVPDGGWITVRDRDYEDRAEKYCKPSSGTGYSTSARSAAG